MKTQHEDNRSKALSKTAPIDPKKPHGNVEFRIVDSLESNSREQAKKRASKPLYLARYE